MTCEREHSKAADTALTASDLQEAGFGAAVLRQEAQALGLLADGLDAAFCRAVDCLHAARGRIAVSGMGKSGHVGRKVAATLASTGSPAFFIHPAEAGHGDLGMLTPDDVVLAFSNWLCSKKGFTKG